MSSLYWALGIPAILSVCCLVAGVFSPAWMIYSMRIDTQKQGANPDRIFAIYKQRLGPAVDFDMDVWMGLWTIRVCKGLHGRETCNTVSTAEMHKVLSSTSAIAKAGAQKLIVDWLVLQILAARSLLCLGTGLICIFIMGKATEDRKRCYGLLTATAWLLTAIFILTAVGQQATDYSNHRLGSDIITQTNAGMRMEYHTPWAIIVSGIGGAWAVVVTVIIVVNLIFRKQQPPGHVSYTLLENKHGQTA